MCRSPAWSQLRTASIPTARWCARRAGLGSALAMSEAGAAEAFWRFSLDFYRLPGVEQALLTLQDRAGHDVNLILYALWLGWSGRGRADPQRDRNAAAGAAPPAQIRSRPRRAIAARAGEGA